MARFWQYFRQSCRDWNRIFREELRMVFRDPGMAIFFLLVPIGYPLLYAFIYDEEVVREVPVAVVDGSGTALSREYLRRVDATAEVRIVGHCADLQEARDLVRRRQAYGIVEIPRDFSRAVARGQQTSVSIYVDMSGLLYYKALLTANTNVSLAMNADIKLQRTPGLTTERQEEVTVSPIAYEEVSLFNPQTGFAAFLIPAVLMLVLQQTLLLGAGMSAGTAREAGWLSRLRPTAERRGGLLRILLGKGAAYLLVYIPVSVYVLGVVPRLFHLNQIGDPRTLVLFIIPYLLACISFALAVSSVLRRRETVILLIVFSSVPLLFISGISWPGASVPAFWKALSALFPSTYGINGFIKINNMGAPLHLVRHECLMLWLQAFLWFFVALAAYRRNILRPGRVSPKGE